MVRFLISRFFSKVLVLYNQTTSNGAGIVVEQASPQKLGALGRVLR